VTPPWSGDSNFNLLRIGDSTGRLARRVSGVRLAVGVGLIVHCERDGPGRHDGQSHRHVTRYVARQVRCMRNMTARVVGRRRGRRLATHSLLLLVLRSVTLWCWRRSHSTTGSSATAGRNHHRIVLVQIVVVPVELTRDMYHNEGGKKSISGATYTSPSSGGGPLSARAAS
jgi:hypothetical protein